MNSRRAGRFTFVALALLSFSTSGPATAPVHSSDHESGQVHVGDMLLDARRMVRPRVDRTPGPLGAAGFIQYSSQPWPGGQVPLQFDADVTPGEIALLTAYCRLWSARANVSCVTRTNEVTFARVTKSVAQCASTVGAQARATLFLASYCWNKGTIVHELGHLFGLLHEHQRSDRDNYVTVVSSEIDPAFAAQYAILSASENVAPYDFESPMHYGPRGLVPKPGYEAHAGTMGGFTLEPTAGDGIALSASYGPPTGSEPSAPVLEAPEIAGSLLTLRWRRGVGGGEPSAYRLLVGNVPSMSDFGEFPVGLATTFQAPLPPGLPTLFVRVAAVNTLGRTASNEVAVTGPSPGPPRPIVSGGGVTNPVTWRWFVGSGAPVTDYVLEVGSAAGRSDIARINMGLRTTISGNAPVGVPYFLRVTARAGSASSTSREVSHTLLPGGLPSQPVLQTPEVMGRDVRFTWTGGVPATGYILRARLVLGGPTVASLPLGPINTVVVPNVPPGSYFVSLVGQNGGFSGLESPPVVLVVP